MTVQKNPAATSSGAAKQDKKFPIVLVGCATYIHLPTEEKFLRGVVKELADKKYWEELMRVKSDRGIVLFKKPEGDEIPDNKLTAEQVEAREKAKRLEDEAASLEAAKARAKAEEDADNADAGGTSAGAADAAADDGADKDGAVSV